MLRLHDKWFPEPPLLLNPGQRFVVRSPSQGLELIRHPAIVKNFARALRWRPKNKLAVLVPCAGTKPFPEAPSHRDGYLAALNGKAADLWVVSEPLGVVPYEWSETWPNNAYDYPPHFLRASPEAWSELAARVAKWLEKVAPKYRKVFAALPGHHERLLRDALEIHNPGNVRNATHTQCLESGACPSGHGRATSRKYRRYLGAVVKNPDEDLRELERAAASGDIAASRRLATEWVRRGVVDLGSIVMQRSTGRAFRVNLVGRPHAGGRDIVIGVEPVEPTQAEIESVRGGTATPGAFIGRLGLHGAPAVSFVPEAGQRPNPDEDLRALERAAASGDVDAAARLDYEHWRRGQPETVLGWLVEHWLWFDANFGADYFPAAGVLSNRVRKFEEDAIDAIAHQAVGIERCYLWPSGEDGWESGRRDLPGGGVETTWDGSYARHFSCRDNRDEGAWLGCMETIAHALEDGGYKVYWVERAERISNAFVELDASAIRVAAALEARYHELVREARRQQELAGKEFDEIQERLDRGEIQIGTALRLQQERAIAGRLTKRERRLIDRLSPAGGPRITPEEAAAIAMHMRSVEIDPYGYNPSDNMEEIARILGSDRGGTDAIDRLDGSPFLIYVAFTDIDRTTLFWDLENRRFMFARLSTVLRGDTRGERANPPCWERLPERERVKLATRSSRELAAIGRQSFPVAATWADTGEPVTVLGLVRDVSGYQRLAPPSRKDANWLLVRRTSGEEVVTSATALVDEDGRPWRHSLPRHCRGHGVFEGAVRNPDLDLRELERRVLEGDSSAMLPFYNAQLRAGRFYTPDDIANEFELIERMAEEGVVSPDDALRLHEERVRAHRQTWREYWLIHFLGQSAGLASPRGHQAAMQIARLMRDIERNAEHDMNDEAARVVFLMRQIAARLVGVPASVETLSYPADASPWITYVRRADPGSLTLYWNQRKRVFGIRTRESILEAVNSVPSGVFEWSVLIGGEEADWR